MRPVSDEVVNLVVTDIIEKESREMDMMCVNDKKKGEQVVDNSSIDQTKELMEPKTSEKETLNEATVARSGDSVVKGPAIGVTIEGVPMANTTEVLSAGNAIEDITAGDPGDCGTSNHITARRASDATIVETTNANELEAQAATEVVITEVEAFVAEVMVVEADAAGGPSKESAKGEMITEGQAGRVGRVDDPASGDDAEKASNISQVTSKDYTVNKIPLHRLMVDYKERKRTRENECRVEGCRKSARPKKAPDTYVAEPASCYGSYRAQKMREKALKKMEMKRTKSCQGLGQKARVVAPGSTKTPSLTSSNAWSVKKTEDSEVDSWQEDLDKLRKTKSPRPVLPSSFDNMSCTDGSANVAAPTKVPPPRVSGSGNSSATESTTKQCSGSTSNKDKKGLPLAIHKQELDLAVACRGKRFPEQLMLLMTSNVASGCIWWTPDGAGKTFAIDLAYFSDDVMNRFFPPNHHRRITWMLKQWGFKRVHQDLPEGFKAYQHPLFERFNTDRARMILPSSSSRELSDRQAVDPFESDSTVTETSQRGGMRVDKVLSQNHIPVETVFLAEKQKPKLPPQVVTATMRTNSTRPFRKVEPKAPPSVRIAALRHDDPGQLVDSTSARRPNSGDEAKVPAHLSKQNVKSRRDWSRTPHVRSVAAQPVEIVDVDAPDSMYPSRDYYRNDCSSVAAGSHYSRHADATLKLNNYLTAVVNPHDLVQSSRDEITRLSLTALSLAAEEERLLHAIMAQQKINASAVEATRMAYQKIATPSQRLFAMERFALAEQERELKRFMLERERALQAQKEQERKRLAERAMVENEEVARRRRLAAALFESAKPKAADMESADTRKKREPEDVSGMHRPVEKCENGRFEVASRTQSEANVPANATLHNRAAFIPQAYSDPLWYCQQRQHLHQQQTTLNGLAAFQTTFSPFQATSLNAADATFEQLLLLQSYSRL